MLSKFLNLPRQFFRRGAFDPFIIQAIILMIGLLCGALICSYWAYIGDFIRCKGVGEFILKFATVAGPTLGIIVFCWQVNRARYTQRIDLILKLAERFDKQEMKTTRAIAARALLKNRNTEDDSVSQLLDFFEEIGFLVARKAVDRDAIYTYFDYWIMRYHQATMLHRHEMNREADPPDFYNKFDNLVKVMSNWAGKTGTIDESKLTKFLVDESKLVALSESNYVD
jgi:hypothetical protein